jgi:hypothetical protein
MPGRDERRDPVGAAFLLLLGLATAPSPALGESAGRILPRISGGSGVEWALARAQSVAEEKLSNESCQAVFSDFRDGQGRPLGDRLESLGHDGASYLLRRILFYSGNGQTPCATRDTIAFTSPGSSAVFVCSIQFVEETHRDPGLAAALLIHEELHSLGLGENPPSSKEITARVIARCGK